MSKLTAVVLTAAICLPLGAVLQGSASAERRKNSLPSDAAVVVRHRRFAIDGSYGIDGHRHLARAQTALHEAIDALAASQRESEAVWTDTSGRAAAMRDAIEQIELALQTVDRTAAWVTAGTIANDSRVR